MRPVSSRCAHGCSSRSPRSRGPSLAEARRLLQEVWGAAKDGRHDGLVKEAVSLSSDSQTVQREAHRFAGFHGVEHGFYVRQGHLVRTRDDIEHARLVHHSALVMASRSAQFVDPAFDLSFTARL
jgi:hypothetical protein